MIRRILLALMLLAVLPLAAIPAYAADPGDGTINGQIVNGTTGVLPEQPFNVTLISYNNSEAENTSTTKATANGTFSFTGLSTSANYTYEVDVTYKDITYTSELFSFEEGETQISGGVYIYETTDDLSVLSVSLSHMIVYTTDANLTVREVYYLTNTSSLAFTGLLPFSLPAEATPTDMAASLVWTTTGGGNAVVDTVPIIPGQRQVDYTYTLPASDTYSLSRHVPLPMDQFNLLIQNGAYQVTSPELTKTDPLDISGMSFDYYTGGPLQANQPLAITLTQGGAAGGANTLAVWLGVIGLIIVIVAVILFFRMRGQKTAPAYAGPAAEDSGRWEQLLDELAALDDQLEAGTISEEEYQTLRDQLKNELKGLMGGDNDGGGE